MMKLTISENLQKYNKTEFISSVINNMRRMSGKKKPVRNYFSALVVSDDEMLSETWRYEVYINPEEPKERQIMTRFLVMDRNSHNKFVDFGWVGWRDTIYGKQWTQLVKEFLVREVGESFL